MPRKNGRHQPPKAPCTPDIRIRRRFRRASVGRPMIAVLVLGISAAMPAMAAARNVSDYDALIQRARAGDHKPALDMLSARVAANPRSEEHTSELQSLMRISYAVFCLKKHTTTNHI